MGLFGSRRVITVGSTAAPLMQPNPHHIKDCVLNAIFENRHDTSKSNGVPQAIVNSGLQSMGAKMNAALKYARNHYVLGLPNQYYGSTHKVSDSALADYIKQDLNLPYGCIIDFSSIGQLTSIAIVLPFLLDTRKINLHNNHVSNPPAAYLSILPVNGWSGKPTSVTVYVDEVNLASDTRYIDIRYRAVVKWYSENVDHEIVTHTLDTSQYQDTFVETREYNPNLIVGALYYVAGYREKNSEGAANEEIKWWYYNIGSNKYPALNPNERDDGNANSYPVIPLRYNNQFISETNEPDIYNTGTKLLKRMGVEFDNLVNSISENPDIAQIDHAYVTFGVDLQTTSDVAIGYLIELFTFLSSESDLTVMDAMLGQSSYNNANFYATGRYVNSSGSVTHTDGNDTVVNPAEALSLTEHGLNIEITYKMITSVLVDGSIGNIDTVSKTIIPGEPDESIPGPDPVLILRRQVATNTYREVKVYNLTHINAIYNNKIVVTNLNDVANNPDEHNMVLPLQYTVAKRYGLIQRNDLYRESMILVINCIDVSRLKWYQTSVFQLVFMVVVLVISISSGQAWVAGLLTAVEAGISALILFLVKTLVVIAAMHYSVAAVARHFGPEVAIVTALTLMAIAPFVKGSNINAIGLTLPTAETFMWLGSVFMQGSNAGLQLELQKAEEDYNDFLLDSEAQMEVLKAQEELLDVEYDLPISHFQDPGYPQPDFQTKPEDFYHKIHVGNIGTLCLDVIPNYVDNALSLPSGVSIT